MYSKQYFINCSDVDANRKLKPSAFFKLFQDTAISSTEVIGFGHSYLDPRGITWVISRVNVEFIRIPDYQETVTLTTYPGKAKMVIYPRHFFVKDKEDNICIKMSSTWALIDIASHSVTSLDADEFRLDIGKTDDELPLPKHIKVDDDLTLVSKRIVRYSDCDLNHHLNNTRYIDYIFDIFDGEFYKNYEIKSLQVDYLSEIKEGQIIELYVNEKNPYQVVGKIEDKTCFIALLNFKKKD